MIQVDIANQQTLLSLDRRRLRKAVKKVLEGESIREAQISLAVVDDDAIQCLNRQYLDHDYATDVLSFVLERDGERLEGEVIVSAETAARAAGDYDWASEDELLLYVIHGALHLAGYLDGSKKEKAEMRRREKTYLAAFGLEACDK
jgi:probable rRNA maturation factor